MTTPLDKVLYTAKSHTTGGRDGASKTSDGLLDVKLASPKELGGAGNATNPEQLFAAGYSACFIGAMKAVAARTKTALPTDPSIDASVSIGPMTGKEGAFGISVAMTIKVPGMEHAALTQLVADAHEVCPYSNATRGNIDVTLTVV